MNRHERLEELMERRGVEAVVLRRPANFAWFTGGEQTPDIEVLEYPWHEDRGVALREVVGGARIGSDLGLPGTVDLSDDIARLRRTLDPDAVESLRAVGHDATAAMSEAAAAVESGMTEHEAAAALPVV
jgi:Xaa-Pro aminopeptidase